MLVTYPMHDRPTFFSPGGTGSDSRRIESIREKLRFSRLTPLATNRSEVGSPRNMTYFDEVENNQRRPISFEKIVKMFASSDEERVGNGD
jgi:hypothetical protein